MTGNDGEIPSAAWQQTLEELTKEHETDVATIEVVGADLGDQFEAEQIPFAYVEYDPHDDAASVGVGGLDGRYPVMLRHVVEHPQGIWVHTSTDSGPSVTIEIRDDDETVTLISLRPRPELPA
jgi:hypothetical protein